MSPTKEMSNAPPPTEDILASIRQILTEDLATKAPRQKASVVSLKKRSAHKSRASHETSQDMLELTAEMLCDDATNVDDDNILTLKTPVSPRESLASPKTIEETAKAFEQIKQLQASLRSGEAHPTIADKSLDEYTQEVMRPLLKQWLDAHLPAMVKSLVAEEIAKVAQQQSKAA